jgi:hypothetical protein
VTVGEDDVDREVCEVCGGSGRVPSPIPLTAEELGVTLRKMELAAGYERAGDHEMVLRILLGIPCAHCGRLVQDAHQEVVLGRLPVLCRGCYEAQERVREHDDRS